MKWRFPLTVLCLLAAGGALPAYGRANLLALAPANSVVVARINWQQVRADNALRRLINADQLQTAFRNLQVNEQELTEVVIFSDLRTLNQPDVGMIVRGTYGLRELRQTLSGRGWREETTNGYSLFANPAERSCLALLRSGALAWGTRPAVENVLAVERFPQKSLSTTPALASMVARLAAGNPPIAVMLALPKTYQVAGNIMVKALSVALNLGGLGALGQLLDRVGIARALGCAISRRGDSYPVELIAIMKDAGAANLVGGGLNLLKATSALLPADRMPREDRERMQVLQGMSAITRGATISIRLNMSSQDLFR